MQSWVPLFPISASLHADQVDHLLYFLVVVCGFFALLIFVLITAFSIRYRRSRHPVAEPTKGSIELELFWTAVPFLITLVMFIWGSQVYMDGETPPQGTQDMYVVGKQWMWKVQHPEGRREINELHVPENTAIKITLTSEDVIHSFYMPAFRVKQDAVPGEYRTLWFQATRPGTFHLFCAEYCGTNHSKMIGRIVVMPASEYQAWLAGTNDTEPREAGAKLFVEYDCISCHGTGQRARAPALGGLYGTYVQLADGRQVLFDEDYIRRQLMDPAAWRVAGFAPDMPLFKGQLTEEQIINLIAYVKSLTTRSATVRPKEMSTSAEPSQK